MKIRNITICALCVCMVVSHAYGKCAQAPIKNGLCTGKICGNGGCYVCCDATNGGDAPVGPVTPTCSAGKYALLDECVLCPEWIGVYTTSAKTTLVRGTSAAGATSITACYVLAGTYYDATGTFTTTGRCSYAK